MIPVSLKLSNFTSYGDSVPELDFSKFQMAAISGSNGAGKSSLLDAITWCVWGWSRVGDSSDQLIRLGAADMYVEFSFQLDGSTFTLKRSRSSTRGGSSALELWSGSNNLTEGTIKVTQQKITDLLHLSFETFTNSSFLRQGHADEFTTKGPTDRKRILADILGLSHYDQLEEKAKEKSKEAQTKLQLLDYQLLEIEAELVSKEERVLKKKQAEDEVEKIEKDIRSLEEKLKFLMEKRAALVLANEQRAKLQQNFVESQNELTEVTKQGINRKNKIDSLKSEIKSLAIDQKLLNSLSDLQKEKDALEKIKGQRLELEKEISQAESALNLKKQQLENLQNQIEDLDRKLSSLIKTSATCPTCGQIVDASHKKEVEKNLNDQKKELTEKIKKISTKDEEKLLNDLTKKLTTLKFDNQYYQNLLQKFTNLENLQKQKERFIEIKATLESEEKVVLELRSLFVNKRSQVDKLKQELDSLPDIFNKLQTTNQQLQQQENQLSSLRNSEKEARNILGQVRQLVTRAKQLEDLSKKKLEEKSALQKEKKAFEELSLAFGKKGIQAMIIETAIPEIEEEANNLLGRLTDGRMKIELRTQRETKTLQLAVSGQSNGEKVPGIIETLDIIISDEMGDRPYENYSGGEQFRVNMAIRLALSKLLTRRAGAKLQFLVIDEGFGTQDTQGRSRIIEVLDTIKDDFEKILIITHLDELKEEFPVRIEVSKNSGGSTFEVIGA